MKTGRPSLMNVESKTGLLRQLLPTLIVAFFVANCFGGLPREAKDEIKERYRESKFAFTMDEPHVGAMKEMGSVLVLKTDVAVKGFDTEAFINYFSTLHIRDGRLEPGKDYSNILKPGQLLICRHIVMARDFVALCLRTLGPIPVTRGIGAFQHTSPETIDFDLVFHFDKETLDKGDTARIFAEIEKFVTSFESLPAAELSEKELRREAARAGMKEVKLGMTVEEVEDRFGVPEKKAVLGEKTVYKYPDMTVEFTAGKVTDVKF